MGLLYINLTEELTSLTWSWLLYPPIKSVVGYRLTCTMGQDDGELLSWQLYPLRAIIQNLHQLDIYIYTGLVKGSEEMDHPTLIS